MNSSPVELANWIPWKLSGTSCSWLYLDDKKITDPFFDDTISVCKNLSENQAPYKVMSGLDMMAEWAENINAIIPSAIIFHVSRCGSTLLSQLLCLNDKNIVLSEVPFFDEIMRHYCNDNFDKDLLNKYLIAAIKFHGQKRNGKEKNLFIKTDSWHLHFYKQLRNIFPGAPFIFLYRNPGEVIHSHQKRRGMQSVPGLIEPEIFGFSKEQIKETNLDAYMTNVLESYFIKMIEIAKTDDNVLLCNYKEGMHKIMKKINKIIDLDITEKTEKLLTERTGFHGKYPQQLFTEDYKQASLYDFLMPVLKLYEQLDTIRMNKFSTNQIHTLIIPPANH